MLSREEFATAYAKRSGVTLEWLTAHGREVRPCTCHDDDCPGWQMAHIESDDPWPNDSPFPSSDPRFMP